MPRTDGVEAVDRQGDWPSDRERMADANGVRPSLQGLAYLQE
jgi:hypothetical protein